MDVSVTDGNQQPVRGLSAKDFTIFEDGKPQSIIAFSSVELPYPAAPPAAWMSNISADVDSNELAQDRLFVIILDDALIRGMWGQQKMREVARAAIRGLGPTDEAAVIFSGEGWNGQSFTTDRARLLRAIDYVRPTMAEGPGCAPVWGSAAALRSAAEALGEVPHRRKIVLYISDGGGLTLYPDIEARGCAVRVQADAEAAVRAAQRSNTNIYGIDPTGLETTPSPRWGNVQAFPRSFLEDLASHTGGGTVYNTNDPAARVPQILAASRSYYLLGYELATHASTGLYHRVEVRANRPGLEVHARTSRYDPKPDSGAAREAKASPLELAVSGYLPNTGLSVQVSATPFRLASAAGRTSIALAVRVPAGATAPQRDTLDIVTRAFTVDGNSVSSVQARKLVTSDGGVFEAGSAIDLRPGRYTLRIAVHSAATGRTGSVYTDVVVPNFKDDGLTLSGALLTSSSPGLLRTDPFGVLVPIVSRSFASDERVRALLRVYQGGTRRVAPVEVKTRIVDEHDVEVLNGRETLSAAAFSPERQADYALSLPLSTLSPGEYWLSIETSIGSRHASRDVRFSVK
jgi:VWFA-related protein